MDTRFIAGDNGEGEQGKAQRGVLEAMLQMDLEAMLQMDLEAMLQMDLEAMLQMDLEASRSLDSRRWGWA
jgi:hypothetical protein